MGVTCRALSGCEVAVRVAFTRALSATIKPSASAKRLRRKMPIASGTETRTRPVSLRSRNGYREWRAGQESDAIWADEPLVTADAPIRDFKRDCWSVSVICQTCGPWVEEISWTERVRNNVPLGHIGAYMIEKHLNLAHR